MRIASSLSDETTMWSTMKREILTSAKKHFGIVKRKSVDWYEKNAPYLEPIFEEKRRAFLQHKRHPSSLNLEYLRATRRRVQRESKACANKYWNDVCQSIQRAADMGDTKKMYEGITKATGPVKKKIAPLKGAHGNLTNYKSKQIERWVEHYGNLNGEESEIDIDKMEQLPSLDVIPDLNR